MKPNYNKNSKVNGERGALQEYRKGRHSNVFEWWKNMMSNFDYFKYYVQQLAKAHTEEDINMALYGFGGALTEGKRHLTDAECALICELGENMLDLLPNEQKSKYLWNRRK